MKTITIRIEDDPKQSDVEKLFVHGISQIMEDLEAIDADSLRLVTIDSGEPVTDGTKSSDSPPDEFGGIVIFPNGLTVDARLDANMEDLQRVLGGDFELIRNGHGMTVYANTDGLRLGLTPNHNASLLFECGLVGPVICYGPPDAEGDVTALSDEQRAMILRL